MKFLDIMKIALHNMWNNKTRTLLVTLVLFILSMLVTAIMLVGFNGIDIMRKSMETDEPTDLVIEYNNYGEMGAEIKQLTEEQIEKYVNECYTNSNIFTNVLFISNSMYETAFTKLDSSLVEGEKGSLISGRLWNKSDENKDYAWISKEYAINNKMQVGDKYLVSFYIEDTINHTFKFIEHEYEVKGIFSLRQNNYGNPTNVILGYEQMKALNVPVDSIRFSASNIESNDAMAETFAVKKYIDENNEFDYDKNPSGLVVRSNKVEQQMFNIYMSIGIIAGAIVLSIVVILMCIGCVSNSIQITVEQNRKFFGMMKAIGLRNATIKSIVRWQAVIMIILAVLLSAIVCVVGIVIIDPLIQETLVSMGVNAHLIMPAYIPFIVLALLVFLVVVCTRKSLNKISKMDVVSVISEVN